MSESKMPQLEQEYRVNISDELTLTPLAGASLMNEIVKGLLYQKSQIPYPYHWLKRVVEKRRKSPPSPEAKVNFTYENHFRTVSTVYDRLDAIMNCVREEFCRTDCKVSEMLVVFGTSPVCPKEVVSIVIPDVAQGHQERNHAENLNKQVQKVLSDFRNIFLSQTWMDSIEASAPCTNTYIYLKKQVKDATDCVSKGFELCEPLHLSPHTKRSKIHISCSPPAKADCCCDIIIFEEEAGGNKRELVEASGPSGPIIWCRSKELLKGFKDCFVNKVSVSELW